MKTPTLAEKLGITPSTSPLLQKAKQLGLHTAALLESLGVARGCWHYRSPGLGAPPAVSESDFSNEELAIALLSPGLPYSPHTIRVGAAMLSATGNDPETLVRLAVMERTVGPVRYITSSALRFEPENPFWRRILDRLPESAPIEDGLMPHPTRFVSMTGMTRAGVEKVTVWLRPRRDLALTNG